MCGKINYNDMGSAEKELKEIFPRNEKSIFNLKFDVDAAFEEYCKSHYKYIVMKNFKYFDTKFVPQEYIETES